MQKLYVRGQKISGYFANIWFKNAIPILAASILSEKIIIKNIPAVKDVITMSELLKYIGSNIKLNYKKKTIYINNKNKNLKTITPHL